MLRNKIELRPGREVKKDAWYKFMMAVKVSQNLIGRETGCGWGSAPHVDNTASFWVSHCPRAVHCTLLTVLLDGD